MILKVRNADVAYALILATPIVYIALVVFADTRSVVLFLAAFIIVTNGMKKSTHKIILEGDTLTVKWCYFLIRRTTCFKLDNSSLDIMYSGSTNDPWDAVLNIFEGKKCKHQVHVKEGFCENEFRELISVFEAMKLINSPRSSADH